MQLDISIRAQDDIATIITYIARENVTAAKHHATAIENRIRSLAKFPFLGPERPRIKSGLRGLIVGRHIVFYTVGDTTIIIVRVIDGRMDVDAEFQR